MQKIAQIQTAKIPASEAIQGTAVSGQVIVAEKIKTAENVVQLKTDDSGYQRLGMFILVLVFGIFGLWAGFAPLGSHAMATGKVKAQTQKQVIQHREGGVIQDIFVKDGDYVEQGQRLMLISPTEAQANKGELQERLLGMLGLEARLDAELEGRALAFPAELLESKDARAKVIIADEKQQFAVRKAAASSEDEVLRQRIQQLRAKLHGVDGQITAQKELADSYTDEIGSLKDLYHRQLISKLQLDETERKYLTVKTNVADLASNKAGYSVQIAETEEELVSKANTRKKDVASKLSETRASIADVRNRLSAANDRLSRADVVAPMAGTVVGLEFHTKGGVVGPGNKILEIVPKSEGFEVEAQVNITDIDKVYVGQSADVMFSAFSSAAFLKNISAEVIHVSADTFLDQATQQNYYRARIKILPEGLKELEKHNLSLVQGMPADVAIKTGERTLLDYLTKPLTKMIANAFNEE